MPPPRAEGVMDASVARYLEQCRLSRGVILSPQESTCVLQDHLAEVSRVTEHNPRSRFQDTRRLIRLRIAAESTRKGTQARDMLRCRSGLEGARTCLVGK